MPALYSLILSFLHHVLVVIVAHTIIDLVAIAWMAMKTIQLSIPSVIVGFTLALSLVALFHVWRAWSPQIREKVKSYGLFDDRPG